MVALPSTTSPPGSGPVERDRLARGDPAQRLVEPHPQAVRARARRPRGASPPCARTCATQRNRPAGGRPALHTGRPAVIVCTSSASAGPTRTVPLAGSIAEHVARPAVGGRRGHPEALALADREPVHAAVAGQLAAGAGVDDRARAARPIRSARKARVSPDGMKQMSWLSGLSATRSPRAAASARTSGLAGVADREHGVRELPLGEHGQHVGLVLVRVDGPAQLGAAGVVPVSRA